MRNYSLTYSLPYFRRPKTWTYIGKLFDARHRLPLSGRGASGRGSGVRERRGSLAVCIDSPTRTPGGTWPPARRVRTSEKRVHRHLGHALNGGARLRGDGGSRRRASMAVVDLPLGLGTGVEPAASGPEKGGAELRTREKPQTGRKAEVPGLDYGARVVGHV